MASRRIFTARFYENISGFYRKNSSSIQGKIIHNNAVHIVHSGDEKINIEEFFKDYKLNHFERTNKLDCFEFVLYPQTFDDFSKIYSSKNSEPNYKFHLTSSSDNDIFSPTRIISNINLPTDRYPHYINSCGQYEYYIDDPAQLTQFLFFNGSDNNKVKVSRVKFEYVKYGLLKRSPNILTVRSTDDLKTDDIYSALKNYGVHRVEEPRTKTGFWKVYVSDLKSYNLLLDTPFTIKNKILEVYPYYGHAIQIETDSIISDRFLFLYSKQNINISELKQALKLSSSVNVHESSYELGMLYTINIPQIDEYQRVRFMNGMPIAGNTDYLMSFCNEPRIDNILHPRLTSTIPINVFDENSIVSAFEGVKLSFQKVEGGQMVTAYPKSMTEYLKVLNLPIPSKNTVHHFNPHFSDFLTRNDVLETKIDNMTDFEIINHPKLFTPTPVKHSCITKDKLFLQFSPDHFENAFFQSNKIDGIDFQKTQISRIKRDPSLSVLNCYKVRVNESDISNLAYKDFISAPSRVKDFTSQKLCVFYHPEIKNFIQHCNVNLKQFFDSTNQFTTPDYKPIQRIHSTLEFSQPLHLIRAKENLDRHNITCYLSPTGSKNTLQLFLTSLDDLDIVSCGVAWMGNIEIRNSYDFYPGLDIHKI
ncbi:hypothetical protein RF11_11054 [Thelohanellus kitauei]|uniref:Uncharacterized protein n=1 Tax=Thelohanellus kitauei TaxID=669202 RepID=A0A0C2MZ36_THEKT|nr:hypothetical protein RF11_11054 [Thelohanellus kitauei]